MSLPEKVRFTTVDGTVLRGDLFVAKAPNPPHSHDSRYKFLHLQSTSDFSSYSDNFRLQLSLLKEHFVDNIAGQFQSAGISALVYDHRGWGSSEGVPKYETNPLPNFEYYHDAITFATSPQPPITPPRLVIWGIGHSGGASMIAGNDPRITAVILTGMDQSRDYSKVMGNPGAKFSI